MLHSWIGAGSDVQLPYCKSRHFEWLETHRLFPVIDWSAHDLTKHHGNEMASTGLALPSIVWSM